MKYEFKGSSFPWFSTKEDAHYNINSDVDTEICKIWIDDKSEFDSHLIAASPELLQAAIDFVEKVKEIDLPVPPVQYINLLTAIHKALNIEG